MNIFKRSAELLEEYAKVVDDCIWGDTEADKKEMALLEELRTLRDKFNSMHQAYEEKVNVSPNKGAAEILADMISEWQLPGAIWYAPHLKRFRLVGEGYVPQSEKEICIGVYLPGVTAEMLADDISSAEQNKFIKPLDIYSDNDV